MVCSTCVKGFKNVIKNKDSRKYITKKQLQINECMVWTLSGFDLDRLYRYAFNDANVDNIQVRDTTYLISTIEYFRYVHHLEGYFVNILILSFYESCVLYSPRATSLSFK